MPTCCGLASGKLRGNWSNGFGPLVFTQFGWFIFFIVVEYFAPHLYIFGPSKVDKLTNSVITVAAAVYLKVIFFVYM